MRALAHAPAPAGATRDRSVPTPSAPRLRHRHVRVGAQGGESRPNVSVPDQEWFVKNAPGDPRDGKSAKEFLGPAPPPSAPEEVFEVLGMGSWRLSSKMDAPFARLVGMVEEVWRQELMDDGLGKHRGEAETKFEFFDSADPEGRPSAFEERASPSKGAPGYPRFVVENRFYQSASFRKLHIEAAWRQDGLQVAHIVHYPALSKDVPILCLDMVAFNGTITLAIIDAAPVTMSRSLPDLYRQMMGSLQARHKIDMQRALPEWGREIFSDLCVAGRPADDAQIAGFLRYTVDLAKFHCLAAKRAPHLAATDPRIEDAMRAQERYSRMQLTNEKTRRILEVAMGEEAADAYMREVMFDHEFAARARE